MSGSVGVSSAGEKKRPSMLNTDLARDQQRPSPSPPSPVGSNFSININVIPASPIKREIMPRSHLFQFRDEPLSADDHHTPTVDINILPPTPRTSDQSPTDSQSPRLFRFVDDRVYSPTTQGPPKLHSQAEAQPSTAVAENFYVPIISFPLPLEISPPRQNSTTPARTDLTQRGQL